jgi:hypothetical protein
LHESGSIPTLLPGEPSMWRLGGRQKTDHTLGDLLIPA